jgi:exodeoxyribonuclease VII large subunit
MLEESFPLMWIAGEVSTLTRAASGHVYFTLKDDQAQVRCTMWRNRAQLLPFRLEHGMQVEVRALVSLFEPAGDYQLNVEAVRHAGVGNLYEAFLRLKARLEAEGLFEPAAKRALPRFRAASRWSPRPRPPPGATSPQRSPAGRPVPITLYPTPVQGDARRPRSPRPSGGLAAAPPVTAPMCCSWCAAAAASKTSPPSTAKPSPAPSAPARCRWWWASATRPT